MRLDNLHQERSHLSEACRRLATMNMSEGTAGNASVRIPGTSCEMVLITPLGQPMSKIKPENLCLINMEGDPIDENFPPSSETLLHLAAYRARPEITAVVHTHPKFAGILAVSAKPLPALLDEMVINLGGSILVADYAFPGTEELADAAVRVLGDRMAVILRNHGLITAGMNLDDAVSNTLLVEHASQIFVYTSLLGETHPLPNEIVEKERELYKMRISVKLSNQKDYGHST
ncbi:class II aldolase/adducin family protein [SAR202 cluster bacterium AD-804-J14_MRT_500m]|nr:class II aldolase/adducin family protein [SAR202 cluster bacterium AD-804-J14_MRT_500m]